MLDFLKIATRTNRRGTFEVYPKFVVKRSSDLMIRGGDFYAVWVEERGLWSTDEQDAIQLIDNALDDYAAKHREEHGETAHVLHLWDSETRMIEQWHRYCQRDMRDNFHIMQANVCRIHWKRVLIQLLINLYLHCIQKKRDIRSSGLSVQLYLANQRNYRSSWFSTVQLVQVSQPSLILSNNCLKDIIRYLMQKL